MHSLIQSVENKFKKSKIADVRSGDTVRVHQRIQEAGKTRIQIFEGLVIRTNKMNSLTASILVRRIASGIGVEKGFKLHSPLIEKIEIVRRSRVRRNYLSYMRERSGKSARLTSIDFDKTKANEANDEPFVPVDTSKAAKEAVAELADIPKVEPKAPNDKKEESDKADKAPESEPNPESIKQSTGEGSNSKK